MYIAQYIYPPDDNYFRYRGVENQNNENSGNQRPSSPLSWDTSNHVWYKVNVTRYYGDAISEYLVQLMVFSSTSMTEEEIVRMACRDITRNVDGKFIDASVATILAHWQSRPRRFGTRIYSCFAIRETDNRVISTVDELPPIHAPYANNTIQDDPRDSVLNSLDSNTI